MGIYEELQARGLIAQVTDEEEIRELINNGKATFYIGFDPTADSLHVSDETSPGSWKQTDRPDRRRNRLHWRSFGKIRYALHDDAGADPAQLRLL